MQWKNGLSVSKISDYPSGLNFRKKITCNTYYFCGKHIAKPMCITSFSSHTNPGRVDGMFYR